MAKEQEIVKDPKVIERLDKIDWKTLEKSTGITRKQIEETPKIAAQLAYGQVTDLVYGSTPDVSGLYALRAIPEKADSGKLWNVKSYTIDNKKDESSELFLYGSAIYSEKAKKALFEQTSWIGNDGKKVFGRANANAGLPIGVNFTKPDGTKEKQHFLVSFHAPTNRLFGIPVDAVRNMLQNEDGTARDVQIYGAKLSDAQVEALVTGRAVKVDGCKDKEGKTFSTCVQFDVCKRQLVPVHPIALKEAERMGVDTGIGRKEEPAKTEKKPVKKAPAAEKKPEIKNSRPKNKIK